MAKVKKLARSSKDKMIFGVAGGIAEYFEIDSTLIRLIFVVTILFGGVGIVVYLILAIVMPASDGGVSLEHDIERLGENIEKGAEQLEKNLDGRNVSNLFALILIAFGLLLLIRHLAPWIFASLNVLLPVLAIVTGVYLLFKNTRG